MNENQKNNYNVLKWFFKEGYKMGWGIGTENWNPQDLDDHLEKRFKIIFRKFLDRRKRNKGGRHD
jgi:hypothetical protein